MFSMPMNASHVMWCVSKCGPWQEFLQPLSGLVTYLL